MPLYACFNGFQGNGRVAVIVEAHDENDARSVAEDSWRAGVDKECFHGTADDYCVAREVEEITLPHHCEL